MNIYGHIAYIALILWTLWATLRDLLPLLLVQQRRLIPFGLLTPLFHVGTMVIALTLLFQHELNWAHLWPLIESYLIMALTIDWLGARLANKRRWVESRKREGLQLPYSMIGEFLLAFVLIFFHPSHPQLGIITFIIALWLLALLGKIIMRGATYDDLLTLKTKQAARDAAAKK